MGYLYYGNYALYYEIGRVELLRSLGLTYRSFEEELGVMMPVLNMSARYVRPARYDDEVEIRTQLRRMPARDIVFDFELYGTGPGAKLLNGGRVALCFVEIASGGRVACPGVLADKLRPHFA